MVGTTNNDLNNLLPEARVIFIYENIEREIENKI